jgi:hypothetical protein
MPRRSTLLACIATIGTALTPTPAHESFLLWHEHRHSHGMHAGHEDHAEHDHPDHKEHLDAAKDIHHPTHEFDQWTISTGARYTRLSLEGERAHLWETGLGVAFRPISWLEVGAEASYGWFDSAEGSADGWMIPHVHVDAHIPIAPNLELVVGGDIGFPGGEEALVGDHWEFVPHLAVRYDKGNWFAEAGVAYVFITGGDIHDHGSQAGESESDHGGDVHDEEDHEGEEHDEHEEEHGEGSHASHGGTADFHEIVDPHGEQELQYHGALGLRLLDERLTLEGRVQGVRVTRGSTEDRNYVRAGLRTTWSFNEHWRVRAEASVPITDARRNHFQGSISLQVSF